MTGLKDLDRIVQDVKAQLQDISNKMGRYKKIDTDLRARALMSEIAKKIEQIDLALKTFQMPSLRPAYENYNFDTFVTNIRKYVSEAEADYQRIIMFEDITEFH